MVLARGKIYTPANSTEIRTQLLEDVELSALEQGITAPPINPGSDIYLRKDATAKMGMLYYASLAQRDAGRRVNEADFDELKEMRDELGLPAVNESTSSGSILIETVGAASVTIPNDTQLLWPNGFRGRVVGTHMGVSNGDPVKVASIDGGEAANLPGLTKVQFVNAPVNVATEATVYPLDPIVGGTDAEDEARLRSRILNRLQNSPGGGNWAEIIEQALNATAAVQFAFVYPALGGPGSTKVVICKAPTFDADPANESFSRVAPDSAVTAVRGALFAWFGDHVKVAVQSVADVPADAAVQVEIPDSEALGGDGSGWVDDVPWPQLVPADGGRVWVRTVHSNSDITVTANTTVAPPVGNTIAWWSQVERRFLVTTIASAAGTPGAWRITTNDALVDALGNNVTIADYISPACANISLYGETWRQALANHGPGENTTDDNRLPVSLRRPQPSEGVDGQTWPKKLGYDQLCLFKEGGHDEITDAEWGYRSPEAPSAPALPSGRPGILIPNNFGIYKMTDFG